MLKTFAQLWIDWFVHLGGGCVSISWHQIQWGSGPEHAGCHQFETLELYRLLSGQRAGKLLESLLKTPMSNIKGIKMADRNIKKSSQVAINRFVCRETHYHIRQQNNQLRENFSYYTHNSNTHRRERKIKQSFNNFLYLQVDLRCIRPTKKFNNKTG